MPDFKSLEAYFKYIEKTMVRSLEEVGREVEQVLKDYIMENWYNRPGFNASDSLYTRTYDYINSIVVDKAKKVGDCEYQVVIRFDTDRIRPQGADGTGRWSRHQSITTSTDVSIMIPLFIEDGVNSPIYSFGGVAPVGNTTEFLERTAFHVKEIMKRLKAKGINVVMG